MRTTKEERQEAARAARTKEAIERFKMRVHEERVKRVYDAKSIRSTEDRSATALCEIVSEHARISESLARHCEEIRRRMDDALARLGACESPSWYSNMIGSVASDVEQEMGALKALADSATRLAWATGWYVPQVMPQRAREARTLLVGFDVVGYDSGYQLRNVFGDGEPSAFAADKRSFVTIDADSATIYPTRDAAWLAAMALVGERI